MKKYIVEEAELLDLLETYFRYIALNSGGVDNWEWYGDSNCDYLDTAYDELNLPKEKGKRFSDLARYYLKDYEELV